MQRTNLIQCPTCHTLLSDKALLCPQCGAPSSEVSPHSKVALALICFFIGFLGIHRFIVGKIGTGFLMLITLGGFGLWTFVDLILILTGSFTDRKKRKVI